MSLRCYRLAKELAKGYPPFQVLIMAAMRLAIPDNLDKLRAAFPYIWEEVYRRYGAPDGILPEDEG